MTPIRTIQHVSRNTPALMLLGTHSNAGKSLLATAFCRIFARRGYRVAPFKAQNMSNNAGVTPAGGEMGRAQLVQAEAAGIVPHTDMNPVLLKPEGNRRSQIILNGKVHGHISAANWFDIKRLLWDEVRAAYDRLAARYDIIVLEGAGSPAEINLKAGDIVNLRMAQHANAPCLLVGDIDRGGVFAALAGTMLLLEPDERAQIGGFLINKFRGDPALLGDGLTMLQAKAYDTPTLGVIPLVPDLQIADEDAVALERPTATLPTCNLQPAIDIAIIQLPHIANFDEFDKLAAEPGIRVRYVSRRDELGRPNVVIIPGTKVTLSDLEWLRTRELDKATRAAHDAGATVVGICGGLQMLGQMLADPHGVESPAGSQAAGLGLLPITTEFAPQKTTHQAKLVCQPSVLFDDEGPAQGNVLSGYEIHAGDTTLLDGATPFGQVIERSGQPARVIDGAVSADGRVWGTYLHGIFGNDDFRRQWLSRLGWNADNAAYVIDVNAEYDRLADAVEAAVDMAAIMHLMKL